jgi:hypothetical protein
MEAAVKTILCIALALLCGCSSIRTQYLADDVREVNDLAFDGKVQVEVRYCDRCVDVKCWNHHGLYVPARKLIHISPEWYWEPHLYHIGIVAHEMIHASLDQTGREKSEAHPHSWLFRQEIERVAKALSIPVWAIPDGKRSGDKLDATQKMAYLESYMQKQIDIVHGISHRETGGVGWPTQLYDPE